MPNTPLAADTGLPRRTFLRHLTAASAAGSALALAATAVSAADDAELLRLYVDFERMHAEWLSLGDATAKAEKILDAQLEKLPGSNKYNAAYLRLRVETGFEAAAAAQHDKLDELLVLADRMRDIPARTLKGFAVKARVIQFDTDLSYGMDGPESGWDWDVKCMDGFVRELAAAAGLECVAAKSV